MLVVLLLLVLEKQKSPKMLEKMGIYVKSYPEDKVKIAFHAAMMTIQNFALYQGYFEVWGDMPRTDACQETRAAIQIMAGTCMFVQFLCVGMGLGG